MCNLINKQRQTHREQADSSVDAGRLRGGGIKQKGLMDMDNSVVTAGRGGYMGVNEWEK